MRVVKIQSPNFFDVNLKGMELPNMLWTLTLRADSKKDSNGYKYPILKYELSLFQPIFKSIKRSSKV